MPKKKPVRPSRTRQFLQSQSVTTGRTIVDILSQELSNNEVALLVQLKLARSASDDTPGATADVKEEPQDEDEVIDISQDEHKDDVKQEPQDEVGDNSSLVKL